MHFPVTRTDDPRAALRARITCVLGAASIAIVMLVSGIARAQTPVPPREDRSVYDVANVIDPEHERAMELVHRELYQKAGVAIVVLTVPELVDETIDELAVRVGQSWGIGGEGQDRGLVLAFSLNDRRIFVATGYGTEEYLPDGRVGALLDQYAMPLLRANRFSEALSSTSLALAATSAQHYQVTLTGAGAVGATRPAPSPPGPFQIVLGIIALIGLGYLAIRHPGLFFMLLLSMGRGGHRGGSGFGGGGGGFGGGGGGFGGGGAGRGF